VKQQDNIAVLENQVQEKKKELRQFQASTVNSNQLEGANGIYI
jgi:hypothetical protein